MFRFPFRSANHRSNRKSRTLSYSSSYGRSSKKKKSIPLLWILALIPATLVGLEFLLRMGVSMTGKEADISGFGGEASRISAYRMRSMTQDGQAIAGVSPGTIQVRSSGLTGYELVPNQSVKIPPSSQTEVLHINEQGLRAVEPVAIKKPVGDVRVLLLGSSTAFGTLSSANEGTIGRSLEMQLNQQVQDQKTNAKQFRPDVLPYFADEMEKALKLPPKIRPGQYRVINAAVPGYLTSNALSQLSSQLLDYQPDVVVLIDGYSDLLVKSDRPVATLGAIDQSLNNATGYFSSSVGQGIADLWNQLYLVKVTNAWVLSPNPKSELLADVSSAQSTLVDRLSEDAAEVARRVDRRTRALEKILQLTSSRKIPLLVGLAPELSHRKSPTPNEKKLLDNLGDRYPKLIQAQYSQLLDAQKKLPGLTPVSLQDAVASLTSKDQQAFVDAVHLTDNANAAIAKSLISAIAPTLYVEPKPYRAE